MNKSLWIKQDGKVKRFTWKKLTSGKTIVDFYSGDILLSQTIKDNKEEDGFRLDTIKLTKEQVLSIMNTIEILWKSPKKCFCDKKQPWDKLCAECQNIKEELGVNNDAKTEK